MQCYGIGPAIDIEDGPKGFGAHSDQERILESRAAPLRPIPLDGRHQPVEDDVLTPDPDERGRRYRPVGVGWARRFCFSRSTMAATSASSFFAS